MNSYIVLLIFIPGLFLIFMFTKASFVQFLIGFGLCLLGQAIILVCYCIVKVQQALVDSTRIRLQQNYQLNVQKQYPFRQRKQVTKIFLNKYTQEEKLQTKKNTLKVHSFQNYLSQQEILNQQPKKQILRFLKQKSMQNNLYSYFNKVLISFGHSLITLQSQSKIPLMSSKYMFETIQNKSPSQISQMQLQNNERQLLDELEIKIRIKTDSQQNILLPSWTMILEGLKLVGRQFSTIEQMHNSNQQIIDMVKSKIVEDFQFIQSQIKKALKSLDQIQKTSLQLKKENEEFLSNQRDLAEHQMDFMLLLKQHYYKYQDFELRIKDNQKNYHLQTKKLSYFREKLTSFYRKNKEKYEKIFKTRFFAILDSYNITIEESIKVFQKVLAMNHSFTENKPPKVNKLEVFKNVDQQIQAQRKYQGEYFQRAKFYCQLSQELATSMKDMRVFLQKVQQTFTSLTVSMRETCKHIQSTPQHSRTFTSLLIVKFSEVIGQLSRQSQHLLGLHIKFMQANEPYLRMSRNRTLGAVEQSTSLLAQLLNPHQALQHKYKLTKLQLQRMYQSIQQEIKQVKKFFSIYTSHSNRTKKILLMQLLYFLHLQRLYMAESDFFKQSSLQGLMVGHNQMLAKENKDNNQNQEEKQENLQSQQQFHAVDNIYTGNYLSEDYVKVLNRFLFSAYSEWKNSQFFKETLIKELYVLLNKDQNESISQVTIANLQLTGYPPELLWVRELHSEPFEFLTDLSIAFKGKLIIYLKTQYKLMGLSVPTEVKVQVEELYCCIRMCFVPSDVGQSWFSFIGQPIAKFTVEPKIYTISINVETIRNFFSTLLLKKLKESTFPIREKIIIPASKEDLMLELIQKRFKSGYHF